MRRLRLHSASEDDARAAATLLTDALATASLPGGDESRLVVIRRLALGRISPRISSPSLALLIGAAVRDLQAAAVAYDSRDADVAQAVAFPSHGDAIVALARLHAREAPAEQWFWTSVVSGWAAADRGERWLRLLDAAHALPEAPAVAAAVVDCARSAGVEEELAGAIPPGQGAAWLALEGWTGGAPEPGPPVRRALPSVRDETVWRCYRVWGAVDDRLVWLATMLALRERPSCAGDARLPARIEAALLAAERDATPDSGQSVTLRRQDATTGAGKAGQLPDPGDLSRHRATRRPVTHPYDDRDGLPFPSTPSSSRRERGVGGEHAGVDALSGSPFPSAGVSSHAGLFFLVPVLERIGFAEYLGVHRELLDLELPSHLLAFIGERVGLPSDDPVRAALATDPPDLGLRETGDLPEAARAMLGTTPVRAPVDTPLPAWLILVRRYCRRHARMGLATLIRRRGRLEVTRTHIEIGFGLSRADVRVRRIALDVDPGWVPWLGRVIRFHYVDDHERAR